MVEERITCINVFKNVEKEKLIKEFNEKWVELINECEKNKPIIGN